MTLRLIRGLPDQPAEQLSGEAEERTVEMGMTHVTVTVRNPAQSERAWDGLFLVDTGATDCMIPGNRLREIGIVPQGTRSYELANGTEMKMDIAVGQLEFMGEIVGATLIFGPDDVEPLLGVIPLESVGIEVDPRSQNLKRLPAVRLKALRSSNL